MARSTGSTKPGSITWSCCFVTRRSVAVEVPPSGGNTSFRDMYSIYDALSPAMKTRIVGLSIKHDGTYNSGGYVRLGSSPAGNRRTAGIMRVVPLLAVFVGYRWASWAGKTCRRSGCGTRRLWRSCSRICRSSRRRRSCPWTTSTWESRARLTASNPAPHGRRHEVPH